MDLEKDQEFLFIAEEGLKAPVPEPWQTYFNENDEIYYVNSVTEEKMFDHPLDEEYKQKFLRLKAEKEERSYIAPNNINQAYSAGNNNTNNLFVNQQMSASNIRMPGMILGIGNKTQDPLIRAEAEKKIRDIRLGQ